MGRAQVGGFIACFYEHQFLYHTGIEHMESKSIQSVSIMKA